MKEEERLTEQEELRRSTYIGAVCFYFGLRLPGGSWNSWPTTEIQKIYKKAIAQQYIDGYINEKEYKERIVL